LSYATSAKIERAVILHIGCAWRIRSSTTYYPEEKPNWSGIPVDANPGNAPAWKEKWPNSKFFAYLISDHSGTSEKFYTAMAFGSVQKGLEVQGPDH
jgi:hypothetical protein